MQGNHGGNINKVAREYGHKPESIIDFSANINFLGPAEFIKEEIQNNISWVKNYPEPQGQGLKTLIASEYDLSKNQIILGNGAVELLYKLTEVLKPKRVMIVDPTFSEYELASRAAGAEILNFKLSSREEFNLTREKLNQLINSFSNIDMLFLCNPNNPTGKLLSQQQINEILSEAVSENVFLVIDEAFIDFLQNKEDYTAIEQLNNNNKLFILRSLTKIYAIPGLRLGFALTNSNLVKKIEDSRDPWSINYFAQLACKQIFTEIAIRDQYLNETLSKLTKEKGYLYQHLNKIDKFKVYQPVANYIFIDLSNASFSSTELTDCLAEKAVMIRNCNTYNGLDDNYIRVAVKSREDNQLLIKTLKSCIRNLK